MYGQTRRILFWTVTVMVLLLIVVGFLIGISYVKEERTYFVFLNVITVAYGLLAVTTLLLLRGHWKPTPIVLILGNAVLSFGHLYFLEYRMFHLLQLILFALSSVYLIFYLIRFFVFRKGRIGVENIHLINPILPVAFIAGSFFCKMFLLSRQVETEADSLVLTFLLVALVCAVVALLAAIVLIKDRGFCRE